MPPKVTGGNPMCPLVRLLLLACLAALVLPGTALADPTITSRDVPLRGERMLSSAPSRFDLVGIHWQGSGSVSFRTRSAAGRWTAWQPAAPEAEDRPDRGARERSRPGWRVGNPWWVGPSTAIRYRLEGDVRRLRAWFVRSDPESVPLRSLAIAGSPPIVPRATWRADEQIRRAGPTYADQLRLAIVHHTAGRNGYSAAEAAAIVRSIQVYHVKGNGWNDIGYNFLVDRFGTVYEGRFGGVDRAVVGAHAEGFNTGSVGVAVIGDFSSTSLPAAAEAAVERLLAWRLDLAHVEPRSTLSFLSNGNARFARGLPVFLRAVSGHRDTGFTSCPGTVVHRLLDRLSGEAQRIGLPKVYAPTATGAIGRPVRFLARLSTSLQWTVEVTDAAGTQVATGTGFGSTVDWTWDATTAVPGSYRWRIAAGPNATPASGTLGRLAPNAPLALTGVAADPETISPNDDGQADTATVTYTLTAPATVTITVLNSIGEQVAILQNGVRKNAGQHVVTFGAPGLVDGVYQLYVVARSAAGLEVTNLLSVLVSRTLGTVGVAPAAFSPNADGRRDRLALSFSLAAEADVRVRVLRATGAYVTTLVNGRLPVGLQRLRWDGSKRLGRLLDGEYRAVVEATDALGTSTVGLPFVSDTRKPVVRVRPGRPLRVWVSEPAELTLRIDGRPLKYVAAAAGEQRIPWQGPAGRVRVVAWDAAGNVSAPAVRG